MNRREFFTLLGAACVAVSRPAMGDDQRRIGVLTSTTETDPEGQARVKALREGLSELGWIEGRNIKVDYRWSGGSGDLARAGAAELVALGPDVIVAAPTSSLAAVQHETRSIPIVFAQVADPVGGGFVASLDHPGGNITGFAQYEFSVAAKWIELLKEIVPSIKWVALIYDPANPTSQNYFPIIGLAAKSVGMEARSYAIHNKEEIEPLINKIATEPNGGVIPIPGPLMVANRNLIIAITMQNRMPNIYGFSYYPHSGGVISYGVDNHDLYRRAASYVDRILKGEKPGDLPVQEATKFELVINLKAAKALGLTVPQSLLATADEVIE